MGCSGDAGDGPGGVDGDGYDHTFACRFAAGRTLRVSGLAPPWPRPCCVQAAPPGKTTAPLRTGVLPREEAHDARCSHASGYTGDHPDSAVCARAPGSFGDEGDQQSPVPWQAHLSPVAHAHARHERGDRGARGSENERRSSRVLAQGRARQGGGVAGALPLRRGQADKGDEASVRFGDRVHFSTVRQPRRARLLARTPLWTTPT